MKHETYVKKLINEIAVLFIPDVTMLVAIPIIKPRTASIILVEFCIKYIYLFLLANPEYKKYYKYLDY